MNVERKVELAACPFCGSSEHVDTTKGVSEDAVWWTVFCEGCDAVGPPGGTVEQAVTRWAMRHGR